jgi:voltage-gated sodium channel
VRAGLNIFKYDGTRVQLTNLDDVARVEGFGHLKIKLKRFGDLSEQEFAIVTGEQGYHRGEIIRLRALSTHERDLWLESIILIVKWNAIKKMDEMSNFRRFQRQCRNWYESTTSQLITASLIGASFVITMAETQMQAADGTPADNVFNSIGDFFNWIFTIELLFNFFCTFFFDFLRDGWNWFDTFVVVSRFFLSSVGGGAQMLRCIRAVRVFRLFKRIPALLRLIKALFTSVPKVLNAFALVLILQSIYAILAVQFFADAPREDDCDEAGTCPDELYGTFSRAFFTMFQTSTLDAWSDVSRSLMRTTGQAALVATFFMSFLLIVTYTLLQVRRISIHYQSNINAFITIIMRVVYYVLPAHHHLHPGAGVTCGAFHPTSFIAVIVPQ